MSDFTVDGSIIAQVAAKVASDIVTSTVTPGTDLASVVQDFLDVQEAVFTNILSLSGAENLSDLKASAPAPRSNGGGGKRRGGGGRSGGGQANDAGAGVRLKFGQYEGQSIAEVYAEDPEYIQWLAESSNNPFIQGKCEEYLASVAA